MSPIKRLVLWGPARIFSVVIYHRDHVPLQVLFFVNNEECSERLTPRARSAMAEWLRTLEVDHDCTMQETLVAAL